MNVALPVPYRQLLQIAHRSCSACAIAPRAWHPAARSREPGQAARGKGRSPGRPMRITRRWRRGESRRRRDSRCRSPRQARSTSSVQAPPTAWVLVLDGACPLSPPRRRPEKRRRRRAGGSIFIFPATTTDQRQGKFRSLDRGLRKARCSQGRPLWPPFLVRAAHLAFGRWKGRAQGPPLRCTRFALSAGAAAPRHKWKAPRREGDRGASVDELIRSFWEKTHPTGETVQPARRFRPVPGRYREWRRLLPAQLFDLVHSCAARGYDLDARALFLSEQRAGDRRRA